VETENDHVGVIAARSRHASPWKPSKVKGQKTLNELASEFGVHPVQITQWKRQLLEASPGIFESGSASRREREQEQLVEQLYQQIGHLKMEVDWLQKKGFSRSSSGGQ
jgi:transposase